MKRRRDIGTVKQILALAFLFNFFWSPLWGLDPEKTVDQYLVDQWQTPDVIPSDTIIAIAQTPDGYLWLAASNDLLRFDGMKFSIIPFAQKKKDSPLESATPFALYLDESKTLWIGSQTSGLTSYQYKTGQFQTFTTADGLSENSIRCIKEDIKGNLWIGLRTSYVNRFSNGEFKAFNESQGLTGKKISAILEDRNGNLLFASREEGLFKYKDGKFLKYPVPALEDHQIITMYEDRQGFLWIGTNNGLFRVTGSVANKYTTAEGLCDNLILSIIEDSESNLWVGTQKGLNRIKKNPDGTIAVEGLLWEFPVICLFEDREKSLWVGTSGSGLRRLKDAKFMSYPPLETHRETVISVFTGWDGDTWCGTLDGKLLFCRDSDLTAVLEPTELTNIGIAAIAEDVKGNLWVGTIGKGIFHQQKGAFIPFSHSHLLADNTINSIYSDTRDNLWFCTMDGISVFRYHKGIMESFTQKQGLSGKNVNDVYEDKQKNIWIATNQGITVLKDGIISKQNTGSHLKGCNVTCIYEDPSLPEEQGPVFWIATKRNGLKQLRLKDDKITSFTTRDGMTTNSLFRFLEDYQGYFWLMSDNGILRVSKSQLNRFAKGDLGQINCVSFGTSDGLKSLEFDNNYSRNSCLKNKKGQMLFTTKKKISMVDPAKVRINKIKPQVVIEAAFFDKDPIDLPQQGKTYVFKGIKNFRARFTAPTFLSPGKIKFKYQLQGFDNQWILLPPGAERVAEYQNLEPGTYTFRVTACNAEGIWNQKRNFITFVLKPFFRQTFIYKIFIFLLVVFLVAAAVYIYKKRPFDRKKKSQGLSMPPQFAEVCIKRLNHLIETEKIYCDEEITLQSLAEKLSIQPYQLSQLLNEKLNQSFSDFINSNRIEEAKRILAGPIGSKRKNTAIAFDVGFNSMTAFYKAFKKHANMTPNQYKKETFQKK